MYMKWNNWLFKNYIHYIECHNHTNWWWAELECETNVRGFGTSNLSRLVHHPMWNQSMRNGRLQIYCLDSFLACSALQGMPIFSTHSWALCKNGIRKYKNESVIPMNVIFLLPGECYLSHKLFNVCCAGYNILVKYWFILNPTSDIW
jgi:hypothetical protein